MYIPFNCTLREVTKIGNFDNELLFTVSDVVTPLVESVTLNTPQNVQPNSTIVISWSFSGVQTTNVALGIQNSQTAAITYIDTNADLTKKSETWIVSVGAGSYKLFFMDETSNSYVYSNTFVVSNTGGSPSPPTNNASPAATTSESKADDLKNKFFIAAPFILLVIIGVGIGYYLKKRHDRNKQNNPTPYDNKTCNKCHHSSLQYKCSNQSSNKTEPYKTEPCETGPLTQKEISKQLYEKILTLNTNEYLENDLLGIDFKCEFLIDTMDDDSKILSKTIAELIGESDEYYYIFKNSYNSKKNLIKHESIEKQRDRIPIERFNCNGLIKIIINMELKIASIHLQHSIIHKQSEQFGVNENIKEEIQKNIHFVPSDIYQILEYDNPNLTQKQVHA
ncbi:9960_t:CDS:2 [Cetraspora pellucida]|uniref:9960_t:CDS:1 n=1 Tax=Cetraspora pellucida TaxID=1433469 RepID=A0A9N9C1F6_9GLOM|nr:9960_t:CDS:2 [Cetraspora pellucida]